VTQLGWLDTNIFVHALFPRDPHYERCVELLQALEDGQATAGLSPLVVHELTYVLLRLPPFRSRADVYRYIHAYLLADAIQVEEKDHVIQALTLWANTSIGFVDAWLAAAALRSDQPVCSVNERDFPGITNTYRRSSS
jgi:predicted nucleic acid-binding protein